MTVVSHEEVGNVRNRNQGLVDLLSCRGEIYEMAPGGLFSTCVVVDLVQSFLDDSLACQEWPLDDTRIDKTNNLACQCFQFQRVEIIAIPEWLTARGVTGATNTRCRDGHFFYKQTNTWIYTLLPGDGNIFLSQTPMRQQAAKGQQSLSLDLALVAKTLPGKTVENIAQDCKDMHLR